MLTSNGKALGKWGSNKEYSEGTPLSQLLFVLALIPLIMLLKWENTGYKLKNDQRLFNHMLFMEDLKMYEGLKRS